ncbi:MAG: hypothetical protein WDA59_00110 [Methanofastidiosum sp.]|jgi:hypothetical protein
MPALIGAESDNAMINKNSLIILLMLYQVLIDYHGCKKEELLTEGQNKKLNEIMKIKLSKYQGKLKEKDLLINLFKQYLKKL